MIEMDFVSLDEHDWGMGLTLVAEIKEHYGDDASSDFRLEPVGPVSSLIIASIPVLIAGIKASRDVLIKWLESRHRHIRVSAFGNEIQEIQVNSVSELETLLKLLATASGNQDVRTLREKPLAADDTQVLRKTKSRKS